MKKIKLFPFILFFILFGCSDSNDDIPEENNGGSNPPSQTSDNAKIYAAPDGADLSQRFEIAVDGINVPAYNVKVAPEDESRRWAAMDDKVNSHTYFETAAFAYFDLKGEVEVAVTVPNSILSVKVLPTSAGINHTISGRTIRFKLTKPEKLTIEVNGRWVSCLHLFANAFESDIPDANDPNVIYYGPGIHRISSSEITSSNRTIYIAGGAIVKAVIDPSENYSINQHGLRTYSPTFMLKGNNIKVKGRGILDASECTTHARELIYTQGQNISVEGIIIKDAPTWTMPIMNTSNITVDNVKILGYRANSDGIDICNSTDVTVKNCFIRTLDDLVIVKTLSGFNNKAERIVVENCILWSEVAHALSVGAEITKDIDNVIFRNCDIIHDKGREWSLRVYQTDKGRVNNVTFENIRIEESKKLMSLWIGKSDNWSTDQEYGHINNVTFRDITAQGNPLTVDLTGYDAEHSVEGVTFNNITLNGSFLQLSQVIRNAYVSGITVTP